jgi:hypothetical protein
MKYKVGDRVVVSDYVTFPRRQNHRGEATIIRTTYNDEMFEVEIEGRFRTKRIWVKEFSIEGVIAENS